MKSFKKKIISHSICLIIMIQLLSVSYSNTIESNVLFYDDFNDNSLDINIWESPTGNRVIEENEILKIEEIVDKGGTIKTKWINFEPKGIIKIERMVKVNFGNEYFYGNIRILIENIPFIFMSIQYSNYIYVDNNGQCKKIGFFINRNGANTHLEADQKDVSEKIEPVWNEWFKEKIEYDTKVGTFSYYINDEKRMTFDVGIIPDLESYRLQLFFDAGGWWTNHIHYMDDLKITQLSTQEDSQNIVSGKIITSSEILGYTATVGGATVKAIPYNISSVTDIYGEFQLSNIPIGECILQIESSYFQTLTKTIIVNTGDNNINSIEIFKPKCQNMYTQLEVDQLLGQIQSEKDAIIAEKDATIEQLNTSIASMYTQGYLDKAIIEAEKRGELKYDINNDGKVGLEEIIKYLETISGVRVESLIIFPEERKYYLSE